MTDGRVFTIDLAELDSIIAEVQQTENDLEALTNDLERQIQELQAVWEGLAADAQQAAHRHWEQGMRAMRAALADLRAAARVAHGNYTSAAEANVAMWEALS